MSREKQVSELLNEVSLDDSFVLGYYGGGNFGDELLMEVLQHMFRAEKYKQVSFLYQNPSAYSQFHKDLGYEKIDSARKFTILSIVSKHQNLVVGGGGLWGLDVNLNVLLMSLLMFVARWLMGKEVYLIGVGYYNSTSKMGRAAAWFAGKSATQILARDTESYKNFSHLNRQTYLCDDIAFVLPELHMDVASGLAEFEKTVGDTTEPTLMISLRRFKPGQQNAFADVVHDWVQKRPSGKLILALMEPKRVDPEGFRRLKRWQRERKNIVVVDFDYNPIVLYEFFKKHHQHLRYVGPQFHVQLIAHLAGVKLLPVAYDNKVTQLLDRLNYEPIIPISEFKVGDIKAFARQK